MPILIGGDIYPLNGVQWSLLFELIGNGWHAVFRRWLTTPVLAVVTLIGAGFVVLADLHYGSLSIGWDDKTFVGGFARIGFGFPCGLLLYRLRDRLPKTALPYPILCVLLIGALMVPAVPDSAIVLGALPLILALSVNAKAGKLEGVARFGGDLSYPLYAIHAPLLHLAAMTVPLLTTSGLRAIGWASVCIAVIAIAWLFERFFDRPLRRILSSSALRRPPRSQPSRQSPLS